MPSEVQEVGAGGTAHLFSGICQADASDPDIDTNALFLTGIPAARHGEATSALCG